MRWQERDSGESLCLCQEFLQFKQQKPNPKKVLRKRMGEKSILAYITEKFRVMTISGTAGSRSTNDVFGP